MLLKFSGWQAGVYVLSLTARAGAFDGALVGQAIAAVPISGDIAFGQTAVFDFHGVAAPDGGILTFAIEKIAGPDAFLYFDVGGGACTGAVVVQTEDTIPPLSTVRRDRLGLVVLGPEPKTAMGRWVAVASRADGAEGSRWRTNLTLRNRGSSPAAVTLRLYTAGGVRSWSLELAAGEHITQTDVVAFIEPAFGGSAPLVDNHTNDDATLWATS